MLKRPVVSAQQNRKTRRPTMQAIYFLDLIDFFGNHLKKIRTQKKEIFIFVKNIILTKNWFVVSIFYEFPEYYMEK